MDVREKLIEIVCDAMESGGCICYCNHSPCFEVERVVNALIDNGVTAQEWISVKDRLPDVGKFVLIYNEINGVCLDYHDGVTFGYYDVTHWMPLPEPPKGE